jgi:putative glycosyltransferase (TIGR04372 family)
MEFLPRLERKFRRDINNFVDRVFYAIGFPGVDHEIKRIRASKDPAERLSSSIKLVNRYPTDPKAQLELALCLHYNCDPNLFEQLHHYGHVRKNWIINNNLDDCRIDFVKSGVVIGSLGNCYALEHLLKAIEYGLKCSNKPLLLLPQYETPRNPALFEYFAPKLQVIRDKEIIDILRPLESILSLPLGFCLPFDSNCPFLDFAANKVEQKRVKSHQPVSWLRLSEQHIENGKAALRQFGLSDDAWYVTLHIREGGYRNSKSGGDGEHWRNSDPTTYQDAINFIIREGGWVFRMGDSSMTPLQDIPQFIDYAHHPLRSDSLDVFLAATSRFCIGTSSGFFRIASLFGVPVILSNNPKLIELYSLKENDLFLPRLLQNKNTGETLSFSDHMKPPASTMWRTPLYSQNNLTWKDNAPDEILQAANELLLITSGDQTQVSDNAATHDSYKCIAENLASKYFLSNALVSGTISNYFLTKNPEFIA